MKPSGERRVLKTKPEIRPLAARSMIKEAPLFMARSRMFSRP